MRDLKVRCALRTVLVEGCGRQSMPAGTVYVQLLMFCSSPFRDPRLPAWECIARRASYIPPWSSMPSWAPFSLSRVAIWFSRTPCTLRMFRCPYERDVPSVWFHSPDGAVRRTSWSPRRQCRSERFHAVTDTTSRQGGSLYSRTE